MKKIIKGAEETIKMIEKLDNPDIRIKYHDNNRFSLTIIGKLKPGEKIE